VGALNPQMVEDLRKTISHRKICFCRHVPTSFIIPAPTYPTGITPWLSGRRAG
jgi:hypothetical protein